MLIFVLVLKRTARYFCAFLLALCSCSTTRSLQEGQYLLRKSNIRLDRQDIGTSELSSYIAQKPNGYILGVNPLLTIYSWGGQGKTLMGRFAHKMGEAPVVYDPTQVDKSIASIQNHLRYIGFYGSQVESRVEVKGRKVYVNYYVALGKRYTLSAIDYEIPSYGTLQKDFEADIPNSTLKVGQFLSESALEQESDRYAQYFRNIGYYGFSKRFFAYEADTLAADGKARLKMALRDYALGDSPASAEQHLKFTLSKVSISYPEQLKIRKSVLENLNILRPGQPYNEQEINTTYARLSSVNMLSGVNMNMNPVSEDQVDCNITLRSSGLQGFKTNLEASVNSSGLMGISPQVNYYHKNLFHGGEILNLGLKGNFQFRMNDAAYSTEVSATSTLRFPMFLGLPNRLFKGPNIPTTDISLAFSYQDRPEYRRTSISSAFTYNGRYGQRLFYQVTPIRANIIRVFDLDEDFLVSILRSIYMMQAYNDMFDLGVSGMLYYTTDASAIPRSGYHYYRLSVDVSGNVLSLFNSLMPTDEERGGVHTIWDTPYAQYVRGEFQAGRVIRFGRGERQALAMRFLAGAGYAYGNSYSLPLDRYFYSGGAMSMRGWQARALGPGNDTSFSDVFSIPSQIGDMKLEANLEYRFPLVWKLEGALFMDAGNIWNYNQYNENTADVFTLETLPESFGLDFGPGLRLNLDFILVRLDLGIRLHDPALEAGQHWLSPSQWISKDNMAIHFGVGYPF